MSKKSWSPYLVGLCIGVLSWLTALISDQLLGITTAFEYTTALLYKAAAPHAYSVSEYSSWLSSKGDKPQIGWEWMLVLGVFVGAYISSKLSQDRDHPTIPNLWAWRFGNSRGLRYGGAFLGGMLMMFGARIAGGCTSGHGISGSLQFAVSSWIFTVVLFITGIVVVRLMFGKEGAAHVR